MEDYAAAMRSGGVEINGDAVSLVDLIEEAIDLELLRWTRVIAGGANHPDAVIGGKHRHQIMLVDQRQIARIVVEDVAALFMDVERRPQIERIRLLL